MTIAWLSVMGICLWQWTPAEGEKNSKPQNDSCDCLRILGGMVIYLADWGNIVSSFVFFIAAIMIWL